MSYEKRRFTRVPFRVRAEMTVNGVLYSAEEIKNLSVGGCLLPIMEYVEPGTVCQVRILLSETSSNHIVKTEGKILRCEPGKLAVKFTQIDPDSLFHLRNIVRYNSLTPDLVEQEISKHPGLKV